MRSTSFLIGAVTATMYRLTSVRTMRNGRKQDNSKKE